MSVSSVLRAATVDVADEPTLIVEGKTGRKSLTVRATSGAVEFGDANVAWGDGFRISNSDLAPLPIDSFNGDLYAICDTGEVAEVCVLEVGG